MKPERRGPAPPSPVMTDSAQALREENGRLRAEVAHLKIASLDPAEEISCADNARLITGLRRHHKLADLLQVAGLPRYQCQAILGSEQQSDMELKIRAVFDEHKSRYGYRRITAALCKSMAEPINHKCVQRLMQKMGLRALIRAKKRFC